MSTVELYFPGDPGWTDVSHLVRYKSQVKNVRLMSHDRRSVIDSYSFSLKYDQTVFDKLYAASENILAKVTDDATAVFAGYIAPTLSQRIAQVAESISLEVLDNSFFLDDEIAQSFTYPATVGGTPYKILDKTDTPNSIVHQLLQMAGYTIPDDISATCPSILSTVLHIAGTAGDRTCREILDTLLFEYGYVLYFDANGKFSVYQWDKDSAPATVTIDAVGTAAGCRVQKSDNPYDGFKVQWTETETLTGALLYRENLPVEPGEGEPYFPGVSIAAGDYFPADGDIKDLFQGLRTQWLDIPYLARASRLENEDISLIASSGHSAVYSADPEVTIDTQIYEAKRARVLFQNTAGVTKKIYKFEIKGTVLFRNARRYALGPSTAKKPEAYTSEFVFDEGRAERLARSMELAREHGDFVYTFSDRQEIDAGTIVNLQQAKANINTNVIIIEVKKNLDLPMWDYVAVGITGYTTGTVAASGDSSEVLATRLATIETQLEVRPTYEEVANDGWTAGTGSTTPTQPTIDTCEAKLSMILLHWDSQANLTNFSHYEIQCRKSGDADWYALAQDGSGKGTVDTTTTVYDTFLIHQNIPYGGTSDAPVGVTYEYRVKRVTKAPASSSYSTTASATTSPIASADVAAAMVTNAKIAASAVDTLQLAAAAVEEAKIAADAVTNSKIATGAVDTLQLAAAAVEGAKIATNAISSVKIQDNAIIAGKVTAGAIQAGNIAAGAIQAGNIAAGAIVAADIAAGTITAVELAANSVNATKIVAGAIQAGKIAAGAVQAGNIAASAIVAADIAASTITGGRISANTVTAGNIAANTITASEIAAGTITASEIQSGTINALLAQVNSLLVVDGSAGFVAGYYASPVDGNERIYMDADEMVFQRHNGTTWVDRIRLGNVGGASGDFKSVFEERVTINGIGGTTSGGGLLDPYSAFVLDTGANGYISILSTTSGTGGLLFGDSGNSGAGYVDYSHIHDELRLGAGGATIAVLTSSAFEVNKPLLLHKASRVHAYRSTTQTCNTGVYTTIVFPSEVFDNLGEYNASTGRFTAIDAGYYHIDVMTMLSSSAAWSAGEISTLACYFNGVSLLQDYEEQPAANNQYKRNELSFTYYFAAGDYCDFRLYQNSGSNLSLIGDAKYNRLSIHRLS